MPKIIWDDSFSVGVEEIDNQHKQWIEIINELHDSLMSGKLEGTTQNSLAEMEKYGLYHFSYEEEYMEKIGYKGLPGHKRKHTEFLKKIKECGNREQRGEVVMNTELMKTLMEWLKNHIMEVDQLYVTAD